MNILGITLILVLLTALAALLLRVVRIENGVFSRRRPVWLLLMAFALVGTAFLCRYGAAWYTENYSAVSFDSIVYTINMEIDGTDPELIASCIRYNAAGIPILVLMLLILLYNGRYMLVDRKNKKIWPFSNRTAVILSTLLSLALLGEAAVRVELPEYLWDLANPSLIFEEEYWHPADVKVEFPEKKRNLIYIFMESMETTFFSEEEGGGMEKNVIPELYQLARENINFSHNDGVGGFTAASGATWTVGGMVGQSSGVPLKTQLGEGENYYGLYGNQGFLPGVQSLGNVLNDAGYNQALIVGSDSKFGGRETYYATHGSCVVYDIASAWEEGIVPDQYHNGFWGMEDRYLYRYAKKMLMQMSAEEAPFALTLLTVDTHFPSGYICEYCENTSDEPYENVYSCASRQIMEFCDWLQKQDFYEDTTIVIAGDHLSMAGDYVARNIKDESIRRVYNCFINAAAEPVNTRNREISSFDMFPTTLAAMGCTIEGERLGLGTNAFSAVPTLMERYGSEHFMKEVARYSEFYVNNFY